MTILDDIHLLLGDDVLDASEVLSTFIEEAAAKTAEKVGFGYVLVGDAPNPGHSPGWCLAARMTGGSRFRELV